MTEFDKKIEASNGYIGKLIRTNGSVGGDVLQKIISVFPDINPTWLLTGDGDMIINKRAIESVKTMYDPFNEMQVCENCIKNEKEIKALQNQLIEAQKLIIELMKKNV